MQKNSSSANCKCSIFFFPFCMLVAYLDVEAVARDELLQHLIYNIEISDQSYEPAFF